MRGRVLAVVIMGFAAFALILLVGRNAGAPIAGTPVVLAGAVSALLAIWLAARSSSSRSAWGRGCLVNGLLSTVVGVSFRAQDESWSGHMPYTEDLDRAIGPLTHFVWALAARIGLAAFVLAAVLFALSYWLLGPPHRKA